MNPYTLLAIFLAGLAVCNVVGLLFVSDLIANGTISVASTWSQSVQYLLAAIIIHLLAS